MWRYCAGCRELYTEARTSKCRDRAYNSSSYQFPRNPLCDLRHNGVSGSESLCKVGRIQSEAKPIIFRRSLPLNHLIPSVRVSDESGTAQSDAPWGVVCQESVGSPAIRLQWPLDRARRWRYCVHWRGVSQQLHGGHLSMTGDQEYATTLLGDSEILSIKHSPKSHIPAVRKGPDDCFKVLAIVDSAG